MFVGNLNFNTTRDDLVEALAPVAQPVDVFLPLDRATGKPRGFAFVELSDEDELERAIALLNGRTVGGRTLRANRAEDRRRRPDGPRPAGPRPSGPRTGTGSPRPRPSRPGGWDAELFDPGPVYFDPSDDRASKPKGSRRNLRARKRSL